jgi:flavodoxin
MKIKVMYHTKTGNTRVVAEAIAKNVGAQAKPITKDVPFDTADLLFIGDGLYAGTVNKETKKFIATLDATKVKKAAVFGTYGGQRKAATVLKGLLQKQGIAVAEEVFECKGKAWYIINRTHPDIQDIKAAKEFAKRTVEKAQKG